MGDDGEGAAALNFIKHEKGADSSANLTQAQAVARGWASQLLISGAAFPNFFPNPMPTLRIKLPNQVEMTQEVSGERITIGRGPDNTVQIKDRSVSGHHATLIAEDGHYRLHDLGSTNLTFVEGEPITDFHLHHACKISFGTVECYFDPHASSTAEALLTREQLEKDTAFLRAENAELQAKLTAQQRRVDMLLSARPLRDARIPRRLSRRRMPCGRSPVNATTCGTPTRG
jgi:hypothetical protein